MPPASARGWLLLALLLLAGCAGCALLLPSPADGALWGAERFRVWQLLSAGLTHWNGWHLLGNLVGLAVLALLGWRAALPAHAAWAWALAGPLGHALLLALHGSLAGDATGPFPGYAGLSGWLHAGVAVAATELALRRSRQQHLLGAAIGVGLLVKLLLEHPLGPLLRPGDWWGGSTMPLAHACGALAGLSLGLMGRWGAWARSR